MEQRFMNLKSLAEYLNTSRSSIRYWIAMGKLGYTKVGRNLLFDKKVVDEWLAKNSTQKKSEVIK